MTFQQAIISGLRHYAVFSGRAPRSAYWFWVLFICLVGLAAGMIDAMLFPGKESGPFNQLTFLVLLLPGLAVGARRLHDIDRSGWWQLLTLTVIGVIPLLIWSCMKGTDGSNRFGPDPLAQDEGTHPGLHDTATGPART
jgi:uncharacterized membrane protein YhaH (DUF805 family)